MAVGNLRVFAFLVFLASALAATWDLSARTSAGECAEEVTTPSGTFFPDEKQVVSEASMAERFEISYSKTFKVLTSHMSKEQYVLTQCGQQPPLDVEVESFAALKTNYVRKHFTVPVQTATAMSTVQLAFLDALDVQDRVSYVSQWSSAPCWQKALGCGAMLEDNKTLQAAQLASVDVVFMDCGAGSDCSSVRDTSNAVHFPAAQEGTPVASAEYIKYMAAFFNKEPKANEVFKAVKTSYEEAGVSATTPPKVAWIAYNAPSSWSEEKFVISQAAYKLDMVESAGGQVIDNTVMAARVAGIEGVQVSDAVFGVPSAGKVYTFPFSAFNGSLEHASMHLWAALVDVDAVVDETYQWDTASYNFDTFLSNYGLADTSLLSVVKNKMVFRIDGTLSANNGLDWFESRLAHPDWAVEGLARALHSDTSKRFKYFRNIGQGEQAQIQDSTMCTVALPVCEQSEHPVAIDMLGDGKEDDETASGAWSNFPILSLVTAAVAIALADQSPCSAE